MSEMNQDLLLSHSYDEIQEYDNPTPGWWWWLFVVTIVFSIIYFAFFQTSPASWTIHEAYDTAVAEHMKAKFGDLVLEPDAPTIVHYMHEEKWLKLGAAVFKNNCTSCHGADASGKVGPNLTDDYYKNLSTIDGIAAVISNGAAKGAMPEWKKRLSQNEIVLVASYVASLRGKNLPSERDHEGVVIPPWPILETADTSEVGAETAQDEPAEATRG